MDFMERSENAAENKYDEMTKNLPKGKFRCYCENIDNIKCCITLSANPNSSLICRQCEEKSKIDLFIQKHNIKKEYNICLKIINQLLPIGTELNLELILEDKYDYKQGYIAISLVLNKQNEDEMADLIYNCNCAIAKHVPQFALKYFVTTLS